MSDITKNDDATEVPAESPLTAPDESVSDVPADTESSAAIEQQVYADGAAPEQQPELDDDAEEAVDGEAPEGTAADVVEDRAEGETSEEGADSVANDTQEEQSFWGGFFGKPNIPTVR